MITICCLKWGIRYRPYYVNKLANMVKRHTTVPYKFICWTDDPKGIDSHIETAPLPYKAQTWWGKMGLYMPTIPGITTEKILFLDLDSVIVGSLDPIINYKSDFAMAKDYPQDSIHVGDKRQKWGNTSVVLLKVGSQVHIWNRYMEKECPEEERFGDQEWIYKNFYGINDLLPESLVKSYKLHNLEGNKTPDCSVVMFHGTPKPPDCGGWVKEHWI